MADDPNEDTWLYGSANPEPNNDDLIDEEDASEDTENNIKNIPSESGVKLQIENYVFIYLL